MVVCFTKEEVTINVEENFLEEGRRVGRGPPVGGMEQRESIPLGSTVQKK